MRCEGLIGYDSVNISDSAVSILVNNFFIFRYVKSILNRYLLNRGRQGLINADGADLESNDSGSYREYYLPAGKINEFIGRYLA